MTEPYRLAFAKDLKPNQRFRMPEWPNGRYHTVATIEQCLGRCQKCGTPRVPKIRIRISGENAFLLLDLHDVAEVLLEQNPVEDLDSTFLTGNKEGA